MGDRVLVQFVGLDWTGGPKVFSPIIYGHSSGSEMPAVLARLRERMEGRHCDVQYVPARCIQEMTGGCKGNLSFGMWNAKGVLTAEESHGDAGCIVVDVSSAQWVATCSGGYMPRVLRDNDWYPVEDSKSLVWKHDDLASYRAAKVACDRARQEADESIARLIP